MGWKDVFRAWAQDGEKTKEQLYAEADILLEYDLITTEEHQEIIEIIDQELEG